MFNPFFIVKGQNRLPFKCRKLISQKKTRDEFEVALPDRQIVEETNIFTLRTIL